MLRHLFPSDGRLEHLLWALMLVLEAVHWEKILCSLTGGVDLETFCEWMWNFVEAVAQLNWLVASPSPMHVASNSCLIVVYLHLVAPCFYCRSFLKIMSSMTKGMIA